MIKQIDDIIDNIQETVIRKKSGKVYYDPEKLNYRDQEPIACCITPVGSFFDENEFSKEARLHLLKRLVDTSNTICRDIILYVEAHVSDFLNWKSNEEELILMQRLNLRIVFGFESSNDFVRNVLYGKNLKLHNFERAVTRAKEYSFGTYAFVFAGLYPMSHQEILEDIHQTFYYLKNQDVSPVVMFANIQEYTISDILVRSGTFKLIHPITVLEIVKEMISVFGRIRKDGFDAWLIADPVGGPPTPSQHIFSGNELPCCSEKIYHIIKALRSDHEYPLFENDYQQIINCPEHKNSIGYLLDQPKGTLKSRTEKMLDCIELLIDNYIMEKRRDELSTVKAYLLCEGVQMDSATKTALRTLGISDGFIHSPNLLLDDIPVNACMMETFVEAPSCILTYINNKFYLHFADQNDEIPDFVGEVDFLRIPEWGNNIVSGYKVSDFLRPHAKKCISMWPNQVCSLGKDRCRFCSLESHITLSPEIVLKMIDIALTYNPDYEVHFSGGIYKNFEENVKYYSEIVHAVRTKHPSTRISLETVPPLSAEGMNRYYESGVNSILMNIEIANEKLRRQICPGKSKITYDRYLESYQEAVERFGKWNVGAVILYGIEGISDEEILYCVRQLCEIGVFPVIMPFQPLRDSPFKQVKATNPEAFLSISKMVIDIRSKYIKKEFPCKFGCLNCGACSIDNI